MRKLFTSILMSASIAIAIALSIASAQQFNRGAPAPTFPPEERARMTQLGSRGVNVHDPSTIIQCKDEYWLFYTGNGVPSYHSKDLKTWEAGPRVINTAPTWLADVVPPGTGRRGRGGPATAPATAQARGRGGFGVGNFWAPDVIHVGDRYLIYFSYSAFGVNTSAIALATNPTLDPNDPNYKWTEEGIVVQSRRSDDFNCIDPAAIQDQDGNLWLSFGSFWSGIRLIQLDPKTGKRISPDSEMYSLAHHGMIEASYIYLHDGYYYLMLDWDKCCNGANSTYNMRVGRSRKITGPYLDKAGLDMRNDGGTLLLGTDGGFIGPGHPGIIKVGDKYWMSMHFYDGTTPPSRGTLAIRPVTWDADGWPVVGKLEEN